MTDDEGSSPREPDAPGPEADDSPGLVRRRRPTDGGSGLPTRGQAPPQQPPAEAASPPPEPDAEVPAAAPPAAGAPGEDPTTTVAASSPEPAEPAEPIEPDQDEPSASTGGGAAGTEAPEAEPDESATLPSRERSTDDEPSVEALAALGHEGVEEHDPVFGSTTRRRRWPLVVLGIVVVLAVAAVLVVQATGGDDDPVGFESPAIDSPLALQGQVRSFADAWVGGDLEAATAWAGACVDELGADGAAELLDATLSAVEVFEGVPRDQLAVRRVVTRRVGGGYGEARIDLEPAPFDDPLAAVGQFLPWRLDGDTWGLDTCEFGGPPLDDEPVPAGRDRSSVIRAMLASGYGEELAICVADDLIGRFGLAALDPEALTDAQDSARLAAEATCRSAPTQVGPGFGLPDNPVPLGAVGRVGDWDARVVDVVPDATELVLDAYDFNEPPPEGEQLLLVRLEMAYRGEPETTATLLDLGFRLETPVGRTYDEFDDTCGLFPDEIDQVRDVAPGEVVAGTMCWSVAVDDVGVVAMVLDSLVEREEAKVWFSLR